MLGLIGMWFPEITGREVFFRISLVGRRKEFTRKVLSLITDNLSAVTMLLATFQKIFC